MGNINHVVLSGRLTRDPELRVSAAGSAVMGLGLAVNDRVNNKATGQWEDYTNFVDCTLFGKRAESLQPILTKGMHVTVSGRLRWSQWEKDGQKRTKLEVVVDDLDLPAKAQQAQQAPVDYGVYTPPAQTGYAPQPQQAYAPQPQQAYVPPSQKPSDAYYAGSEQMGFTYSDEEIPF